MKNHLDYFPAERSGKYEDENVAIYQESLIYCSEDLNSPPIYETERYVLAASCRLDNRPELHALLGLNEDCFGKNATCDAAYILAAYEKFQEKSVEYLIGDFSFVVWDKIDEKLFMAKDQLGIRPLFYFEGKDVLVFSSSMGALREAISSELTINEEYVAYELLAYQIPVELTTFNEIKRLKPAHYAYYSFNKSIEEKRYWELKPIDISNLKSDEERMEALMESFKKAVKDRMRGHKPIGTQLSGGMDSSAITVLASRLGDINNLHTYSFVLNNETRQYSKKGIDEQDTQKAILDYADLNRNHHHPIENSNFKNAFDEFDYTYKIMGGNTNSDATWQISLFSKAKENKVGTIMSGFPGDELVSNVGSKYFYEYISSKDWKALWSFLKEFRLSAVKKFAIYFLARILGTHGTSVRKGRNMASILNPESRFNKKLQDSFNEFYPSFKQTLKESITRSHTTLRTESEGAYALAEGVYIVYPLADIRMLELAYSFPPEMYKPNPLTRSLFRNLCKDILPDSVRLQKKSNGAKTLAYAEYINHKQYQDCLNYLLKNRFNLSKENPDPNFPNYKKRKVILVKIDYLIEKFYSAR